jgi:hypothetical protein
MLVFASISSHADERDSASEVDEPIEPPIVIAYRVSNLPVWQIQQGQPQFDATVVIAHLRNYVDPATQISSSSEHQAIVVLASRRDHDVVRRVLAPLGAFGGDTANHLASKIENARTSNQRVLLFATDPNSTAVKRFFDLKFSDEHQQFQKSLSNYILQCIPGRQSDLLNQIGVRIPHGQGATLAVLDSEGKLAAQIAFADVESNDGGLDGGLVDFLELHRPEITDARESLSSGYKQAVHLQKRVLLVLSGPNCGPCLELARFLEAQHELITKDYVCVKLDTRMSNASEVVEGIKGEAQGPVPWMAILAADGNVLATSDGPDGNIGYPRTKQNRDYFQKMLSSTSQRLTNDELAAIIEGLGPTIELGAAAVRR